MSEQLDLFAIPDESSTDASPAAPRPMTTEQRGEIRALFAQLNVATASEQFALVDVLVGVKLRSVADLDWKNAAILIPRLRSRIASTSPSTGNAWADRDEDTWIDNL